MGFGNVFHKTLGQVNNPASIVRSIDVPKATIIMGSAAIGAFVGTKIGGPFGTAVGAIVGSHVGALALGQVESLKISVNGFGMVEVAYQCA
jgi:outer membrane lipoprotein SlyB